MNFILCNEKCKHQKEGYCSLEGSAKITNAVTSSKSGCCYYEGIHANANANANANEIGEKSSNSNTDANINPNSNIESKS